MAPAPPAHRIPIMIAIVWLAICATGVGGDMSFHRTSTWNPPVYMGRMSRLTATRLYIFDHSDLKVKVYQHRSDLQRLRFLWETPGRGEGPGEMRDQFLVNMAIDPTNGEMWLSTSHGFQIFSRKGVFQKTIKRSHNRSFLLLTEHHILMTSKSDLMDREYALAAYAKQAFRRDHGVQPSWNLPFKKDIPILPSGAYLGAMPEIHLMGEDIIRYDSALGEIRFVTPTGEELATVTVRQSDKEALVPVDFRPFERRNTFSISSFSEPYSGMACLDGSVIWLVTRRFDPQANTRERVLNRFSLKEGKTLARYRLPGEEPKLQIYLIGLLGRRMMVFDTEEGDLIYELDPEDLVPLGD